MLWACPCQTPLFGMPFYISTPIFKASFLLPSAAHALILIPLQWDGSSKSLYQSLIPEVYSLYSHFLCSWKRCECYPLTAESELDSETWEHNRTWLAVWVTEVGCTSFLSHCHHDAIFNTSFLCRQQAYISVYLKEMNSQTKAAKKENPPSWIPHAWHRHMLFNSLLYILS